MSVCQALTVCVHGKPPLQTRLNTSSHFRSNEGDTAGGGDVGVADGGGHSVYETMRPLAVGCG